MGSSRRSVREQLDDERLGHARAVQCKDAIGREV